MFFYLFITEVVFVTSVTDAVVDILVPEAPIGLVDLDRTVPKDVIRKETG